MIFLELYISYLEQTLGPWWTKGEGAQRGCSAEFYTKVISMHHPLSVYNVKFTLAKVPTQSSSPYLTCRVSLPEDRREDGQSKYARLAFAPLDHVGEGAPE